MSNTHRVVVTDLATGIVTLDQEVDIDLQGSNAEEAANLPEYNQLTQSDWHAMIAAYLVAPTICPFDCDRCRE